MNRFDARKALSIFAILIAALFASPAIAQESLIEQRLESIESVVQPQGPKVDRDEIAKLILQATKQSDLSRFQKNRIERVMTSRFRSAAKDRLINRVTDNLLAAGALEVTPDGAYAAIDIRAIIAAIEKWLPVLLQLLSLFGL